MWFRLFEVWKFCNVTNCNVIHISSCLKRITPFLMQFYQFPLAYIFNFFPAAIQPPPSPLHDYSILPYIYPWLNIKDATKDTKDAGRPHSQIFDFDTSGNLTFCVFITYSIKLHFFSLGRFLWKSRDKRHDLVIRFTIFTITKKVEESGIYILLGVSQAR